MATETKKPEKQDATPALGADRPQRKPYVKPRVEETEPLENVTLLSGGVNPTTANPFVQ